MNYVSWCKKYGYYTWLEFKALYLSSFESLTECKYEYEEIFHEYITWCKDHNQNVIWY